jgi:fatty-acyl-CoA synthase
MARPQEGGERLFAALPVGFRDGEGSDPPSLREAQGRLPGRIAGGFAGLGGILVLYSRRAQCRAHPPFAIAAPAQSGGAGGGKAAIVDIAQGRHPFDQRLDRRVGRTGPAALAQLALEVGGESGASGGVPARIAQCRLLQRPFVERRPCLSVTDVFHRLVCATVGPDYERASGYRGPSPYRRLNGNWGPLRPMIEDPAIVLEYEGGEKLRRSAAPGGLQPTPTDDDLPRRFADFPTMTAALDYAAQGVRGLNFHDARGTLVRAYPYSELRKDALDAAHRLIDRGFQPGDRITLVAETAPQFIALFFGALYAGAWPVPLPLPTSFGGREAYVEQLATQLRSAEPKLLLYPAELAGMASEAAEAAGVESQDWETFGANGVEAHALPRLKPDDVAYLQYSSGSTRFPHGVIVTHRALLSNLAAHAQSMKMGDGDRGISWLPFYHDMGLVGCMLTCVANQMSVDYLKTEDFARRPLAWLDLISRNQGNTMSYSPSFGYDICARRVSSQMNVAERFDLSRWRVAGNGADMIRPDVMQAFVDTFAPAGFKASSFLPSYGLAEATLAVTVMPPGEGIVVEMVEETLLAGGGPGERDRPQRYRAVVNCGRPVNDMAVEIRGDDGSKLSEREIGKVYCRGAAVMAGYFRDEEATAACLDDESWLDTGDMGYLSDGYLYIVGRAKDMIIINGKNHWPQDIEWAVEQLPGFKAGDIAAFAITTPGGEETPAVLVQCRTSDTEERGRLRDMIRERVRAITGINCVIELVPPRSLPRTSSGKLSRAKARNLYLSGEIQAYAIAA